MREIYGLVAQVLIYLGEPDETTPAAFEFANRMYGAFASSPKNDSRSGAQWCLDSGLPPPDKVELWEPLHRFFGRPWFRRKWVVQEATVAKLTVLMCGGQNMSWSILMTVIIAASRYGL